MRKWMIFVIFGLFFMLFLSVGGVSTADSCGATLQSMIDNAGSGEIIFVPACIYRETINFDKPLALIAEAGAEIRGSDVIEEWEFDSVLNRWRSVVSVPNFYTRDTSKCVDPTNGCNLPEQVFVNGQAYEQVAHESVPSGQQFALDSSRRVVLGDDPTGKTIEVTMRRAWVLADGAVDDVVIKGFSMKHVSRHAQGGGGISLEYDNHNWTIEHNRLSDSHADLIQLAGTGHKVLNNELFNAGWVAINGNDGDCVSAEGPNCDTSENRDNLIQGNRIYNNNIGGFNYRWAGGGVKLIGNHGTVLELNEVYGNVGPGLWCDIECRNIIFRDNCLYDNVSNGIFFEISSGAEIYRNRVFNNGFGYSAWGWGSGILVSGASLDTGVSDAEIYENVVAWNADGIGVVRPGLRGGAHEVTIPKDNLVRDNVIALDPVLDGDIWWAMGWLEDPRWDGEIWEVGSNNLGRDNQYWVNALYTNRTTFRYDATNFNSTTIAGFNATLGEENGRILTDAELQTILSDQDMPLTSSSNSFDCTTIADIDFGDAPLQYPTAGHWISNDLRLGNSVDADSADQVTSGIEADSSDNGVTFINSTFNGGLDLEIDVVNTTGQPATLIGFIDLNGDGLWTANETMTTSVSSSQTVAMTFANITSADSLVGRFRITSDASVSSAGIALDGEVEDYVFTVVPTSIETSGLETESPILPLLPIAALIISITTVLFTVLLLKPKTKS